MLLISRKGNPDGSLSNYPSLRILWPEGLFRQPDKKTALKLSFSAVFYVSLFDLALADSAHGASTGAGAAIQASASIDLILGIALGDSTGGAGVGAGAAADTSAADNISHWKHTSIRMFLYCIITF